MMQCPHCGACFFFATAWSSPEPRCEAGIICPVCEEFLLDEEIITGADVKCTGDNIYNPTDVEDDEPHC